MPSSNQIITTDKLTKKITFRVTESDYLNYKTIFANAKVCNKKISQSEFIRTKIFNENIEDKIIVQKEKVVYKNKPCLDEKNKIYQLSKIGNNLNQLTHKVNMIEDTNTKEILSTLSSIELLLKEL